jgi:hypothetical protein
MNPITDLSKLIIGQEYLIETTQTEYDGDSDSVERKYKFIGTYSGVSEPVSYNDVLTPNNMEYKYTFNSFCVLIEDPDYYEIYSASFPLNIDYERCLRISQLDSLNNKTKVYLSFHSQLFEQRRVLRQMLESILQGHSLDIINYTSEFL